MNRVDGLAIARPSSERPHRSVGTSPGLIAVLAALTPIAPFSIDMYLSAFPQMARDLFAPAIEILVCLRFVQGFTGAAGVVIARAVIADRARGHVAAQLFSTMKFTSLLAPLAAPVLGGVIVTAVGWRAVFVALAVMNLMSLLGVVLLVDESLPKRRRRPSGLKALVANACSVLGNRHYVGYTATTAFIAAAMFAYASASPFVLRKIIALSPAAYSYTFASFSLAIAAGVPSHASPSRALHRVGCWRRSHGASDD